MARCPAMHPESGRQCEYRTARHVPHPFVHHAGNRRDRDLVCWANEFEMPEKSQFPSIRLDAEMLGMIGQLVIDDLEERKRNIDADAQ